MESFGYFMAVRGWLLRTGGAPGADQAFERGCDEAGGDKLLCLPWDGFERRHGFVPERHSEPWELALSILCRACRTGPSFWATTRRPSVEKLIVRNVFQVLGTDLRQPSRFVVCWTRGGRRIGGTSYGIQVAEYYSIPVINLGRPDWRRALHEVFDAEGIQACL